MAQRKCAAKAKSKINRSIEQKRALEIKIYRGEYQYSQFTFFRDIDDMQINEIADPANNGVMGHLVVLIDVLLLMQLWLLIDDVFWGW